MVRRYRGEVRVLRQLPAEPPRGAGARERLEWLIYQADVVLSKPSRRQQAAMHAAMKGLHLHLFSLPCFVCLGVTQCRHHVIQVQHGGDNRKSNVVGLCHRCHKKVHPWLKT